MADGRRGPRIRGRWLAVGVATSLALGTRSERAGAQWLQITQAAPASGSVGPNWAVVTYQFGGSYGTTKSCNASGACAFYNYDYSPAANALQFTVNGVRQDRLLRVTNTAESCTNNSDGTQSCSRTYTATNGKLTLPPNATTQLFAQLAPPNASVSQAWSFAVAAADRAHPLISVGAQEELNRDVGRCVAACFDAVASVSTPTYTSLDVARGVTLVYRSNRGRGAITLDVTDPSSTPPARINLRLTDVSGGQAQAVTFDNGSTALEFTRGQSQVRLVGAFSASGLPYGGNLAYGAYPYEMTATVTSVWSDGDYRTVDVPVRMPIEGQWSSPYGAGWTVAGVRTIRGNAAAGRPTMTVLDGTGTVQVLDGDCAQLTASCQFVPPAGVAGGSIVTQGDGADSRVIYRQALADGSLVGYDANGNEVVAVDRVGRRTTYWWRDYARLDHITDPANQTVTFQYDANNRVSGIVDPTGRRTAVQVDGNGDLVSVTDPLNQTATYGYQNHRLVQYTQAGGGTWNYAYDAAGKLLTTTAPAVQTKDGTQQPVTRTQSSIGQRLAGTLSGQGSPTNPLPGTTSTAVGELVTDAGNNTVTYLVDRYGQPSYMRTPDGAVTTVEENEMGFPTRAVGANGHDVRAYPNSGVPWLVDSTWDVTTGRRVRYTYDQYQCCFYGVKTVTGDVTPVTNTWSNGRLVSTQTGVNGPTTRYNYGTDVARPDNAVDQNGHTTAYVYATSGLQNTASATTPGGTTKYGYDAYGRLQTVTNPRGDTTHTDYDALNRVIGMVDGLGHRTRQQYGALYPSVTTDAKGATYQQTPNVLGAVQSATDPAGGTTAFSYYGSGALWQTTDRRGAIAQFGYDAMGRVTWTYLSDVANPSTASPTFWYDPNGHLAVAANAETIDSVFYDNAGRVVDERHVFRALAQAGRPAEMNVTSAYDAQSRRTQVQLGWVNHWSLTLAQYRFNALGQLDQLTDPAGQLTSFNYNGEGALTVRTLPGVGGIYALPTALHEGAGPHFAYPKLDTLFGTQLALDSLGRIRERISTASNRGPGYQFDNAGRLRAVSKVSYNGSPNSCTPIYGTSPSPTTTGEQPTAYNCPGSSNVVRSETYGTFFSYDAVGNPTYGGANYASVADSLNNRLATFNGQRSSYDAAGNRWMHTDVNGNWLDRPAWNVLGQMKGVRVWNQALPAGPMNDSVDFGYDALGRRVRKTVVGAGRTTYYVWDGDQVAAEMDENGIVTASYAYYPGVDQPHSVRLNVFGANDRTAYYVQGDAPGNVLGLVDANGAVQATYQVDEWGQPTSISEPGLQGWQQPYLFAGRTYDRETGYYYNRARYYDPVARRFISEDPKGLAGGMNLYEYAGSDPVDNTDPTGRDDSDPTDLDCWTFRVRGTRVCTKWECTETEGYNVTVCSGGSSGGYLGLGDFGNGGWTGGGGSGSTIGPNYNPTPVTRPTPPFNPRCALNAGLPVALDFAGVALTALAPEASLGAAVAGSLIGVASIATSTLSNDPLGGSLAYAGKEAGVFQWNFEAAAQRATASAMTRTLASVLKNVSLVAGGLSLGRDVLNFGDTYRACLSGP